MSGIRDEKSIYPESEWFAQDGALSTVPDPTAVRPYLSHSSSRGFAVPWHQALAVAVSVPE